jgi:1-acyl-sn-glycerol-3-phosphate acyltransferase
MLRDAIRWTRSTLVSIPVILAATIVASAIACVCAWGAPRQRQQRVTESCKRTWAKIILAASFVRVSAGGLENIPRSQPHIICANHLSYLDPPVLIAALPGPVRFVAKKSLFAIPFLGWAMRLEEDVAIDRGNARSAARSLSLAEQRVRAGTSLVIFPEGERSPEGTLQAFLSGAFRLAIGAQVPILPIAISGTGEALRPGSLFLRGGTVRIAIGAPVPTEGLTSKDAAALCLRVEQIIRNLLCEQGHERRSNHGD